MPRDGARVEPELGRIVARGYALRYSSYWLAIPEKANVLSYGARGVSVMMAHHYNYNGSAVFSRSCETTRGHICIRRERSGQKTKPQELRGVSGSSEQLCRGGC